MRGALLRFGFVYFALFYIPAFAPVWDIVVPWVGHAVLGIDGEIPSAMTGSGDRLFDWVLLFCQLVLATSAAIAWSIAAPHGRHDDRLRAGLRVGLRYALAFFMLGYGLGKLFPLQFSVPGPWRLSGTYGDSSPMGLLWTFMGQSPAYEMFTGFAETLGGVLLLARRTTTLGAMVVVGVMANVVMLNFCYDVPVKILSTHLLVTALVLLAPDARRLADVLVHNRASAPVPLRPAFASPRARRRWLIGKSIAVAAVVLLPLVENVGMLLADPTGLRADPPVHLVESRDETRWRRVLFIPETERLIVARMDGERLGYRCERDGPTLVLTPLEGEGGGVLVETRIDEQRTMLSGELDGQPVALMLRRLHTDDYLLATRGFHWVSEAPFNR